MLEIKNLTVELEGVQVINNVSLTLPPDEKHLLIGANGAGKTSLALALMGSPKHNVTNGDILLDGESIVELPAEERAKRGLFLGFQHPMELPGVSLFQLMRASMKERGEAPSFVGLKKELESGLTSAKLEASFIEKNVNEGSGGEKKRLELVQSLILKPKYAIFDEMDSGVDLSAQSKIAEVMNSFPAGVLAISHRRFSQDIEFNRVYLMSKGEIIRIGGMDLYQEAASSGHSPN